VTQGQYNEAKRRQEPNQKRAAETERRSVPFLAAYILAPCSTAQSYIQAAILAQSLHWGAKGAKHCANLELLFQLSYS